MAIEWQNEQERSQEIETIGTVHELMGKGGKLQTFRKNINGTKRVTLKVFNKAGKFVWMICSQQISDLFREKQLTLRHIAGFNVTEQEMENEEGVMKKVYFVMMPAEGAMQEFKAEELKPVAYESAEFLSEEMIGGI